MAETRQVGDDWYALSSEGWRRVPETDAAILQGPANRQALKASVAALAGVTELFGGAAIAPQNMQVAEGARTEAGRQFGIAGDIARVRPEALAPVSQLLDALDIAAPLAAGGRAATRRVMGQVADAMPVGRGGPPGGFGASSAGAAQAGPVRGVGRWLRGIDTALDEPRRFSADQAEVIESGLYRDVGFEFPPGSMNSAELYGNILTNPLLKGAADPFLARNAATLTDNLARAMFLDPADYPRGFSRGMVSNARRTLGQRFDRVRDAIDGTFDLSADAELINRYVPARLRTQWGDLTELNGGQLMRVRSQLNKSLDRIWNSGADDVAIAVQNVIDGIDDQVADGLADAPGMLDFWADTREAWRTFKSFDRPGVVNRDTGEISLKGLVNALEKQYDDFAAVSPTEIDELPTRLDATRDLMKFARVSRLFGDSLPNSGTPTRSFLQSVTSGKDLLRFMMLRRNLEDIAISPEDALALSDSLP